MVIIKDGKYYKEPSDNWQKQLENYNTKKLSFFRLSKKRWLNDWHDLNIIQRTIMLELWLYAGNKSFSWPSQTLMARDLNVTTMTIKRNLKTLMDKSFIKVEKIRTSHGRHNKYNLLK